MCMFNPLNIVFPQSCIICKRPGGYLCPTCSKLFKHNLPECYICRRLSPNYSTHKGCRKYYSLNMVYVAWEYNKLTRDFIRDYKYKRVYDMQKGIADFFLKTIQNSSIKPALENTLLVPIPISKLRRSERGFNQVEYITKRLSLTFNSSINYTMLKCFNNYEHQSLKDKSQRSYRSNPFQLGSYSSIADYKSITLVDDVITTGATLEQASKILKKNYGLNTEINALCLFRGKPYYLP